MSDGDATACMVVVYFDGCVRDALLLQRVLEVIGESEKPRLRYWNLGWHERAVNTCGDIRTVMAEHARFVMKSNACDCGIGNGTLWDVHIANPDLTLRPLPHPAYLRVIKRITKKSNPLEWVRRVFDAADGTSNTTHGFAVAGTDEWLHFGHRYVSSVQPLTWQENVETYAWRFSQQTWAARIRTVGWGTYVGPTMARRLPAGIREDAAKFVAEERFDNDLIWHDHCGGGISVFVAKNPLETVDGDLPMPDDSSYVKAGWLVSRLRDCELL
jgi:hypothetical protein